MRRAMLVRALMPWAAVSLLTGSTMLAPMTPAVHAATLVARAHHPRFYGYLMDRHPAYDSVLEVYSKTHATTYRIVMTATTVVKVRSQNVPRARLQYGMYVIVTCQRLANGTLVAIMVHIEKRRASRRRSTRH